MSTTDFKLVSGDTRGGLFVMEHSSQKKGAPRAIGDSVLGPREIPHTWAFVVETPGKMLIALAPANKMEEFFRSFKPRGGSYSNWNDPQDKERHRAHGLELLGPPLSLE